MNKGIVIILGVIMAVAFLIIWSVDFYFYLLNRYCRFHIGRWEDYQMWSMAIEKVAIKWVKSTPTVKKTDNSRYILIDMLHGEYRNNTIQSWQKAALILGLLNSNDEKSQKVAKEVATNLIDEKGMWKNPPVAVDCGMLSYAVMKAVDNPMQIKAAMDYSLSIIEKNMNSKGVILYTGGKDNQEMYVDTLGLVCPFLVLYANVYSEFKWEEVAFKQLEFYHKYGLYKDTSLPNHAFNIETKLPLGVFGWGRGTAWYLTGMLDSYEEMHNEDYRMKVRKWISEAAKNYKRYQQSDGGFGATLQRMNTYDSSATAVFAWFYVKCAEIFNEQEYRLIAIKCIQKLMKVTRINGKLDWCQGDTKGIGIFAQTYDIMPFAQGMALRAIYSKGNKV